ncbi:MAG: putative baseplate assembly protein [Pseudomonadota bacterium]
MEPSEPRIPDIEAKSAETIFEALRSAIPRYLPEWNDYNEGDPGIAMLQLFAILGEGLAHQIDGLPERLRRELLDLVGVKPRPALPAQVALTFTADPDAGRIDGVAAGAQVAAPGPDGRLIFETSASVDLITQPLAKVMVFDGADLADVTAEHEAVDQDVLPFGLAPTVGAALMLGFAVPKRPPPPEGRGLFPGEMRFHLFKRPVLGGPPVSSADEILVPPVRLVAEYRDDAASPVWRRLPIIEDTTAAFLREGTLRIAGPQASVPTVERPDDPPLHWIRLRLAAGAYPAGRPAIIDALWPNTVPARQETTRRDEFVAEATGLPDQEHTLARAPVITGSVELFDNEGTVWEQVETLAEAGPDEPVYELEPAKGLLCFGTGRNGRIPAAGLELFARQYRHGGGAAGNVPAGAVSALVSTLRGVAKVENRLAARGGADAETADELAQSAPARLRGGNRLITAADFAAEAARPPQVARAHALAAFHPDFPALETPGVVTLLVLPESDAMPPPAPDPALLNAIVANMEPRRPIGVEIVATGPAYRRVSVEATVDASPRASLDAVRNAVTAALDGALSPLHWPFGRDLRPVLLLGPMQSVEGVLGVARFDVFVDGMPVEDPARAITLARHELTAPGPHDILVRYGEDR